MRRLQARARVLAGRCPRAELLVGALGVLGLILYTVLTLVPVGPSSESAFLEALNAILTVAAAGLCLMRALRSGEERRAWLLVGTGLACYAAGFLVYNFSVEELTDPPSPSIADLLWLSMFPFCYAGLVLLVRHRLPGRPGVVWLDGLVGALGTASLAASFAYEPVRQGLGGTPAKIATGLAFVGGDVVLLMLAVAALSMVAGRASRAFASLAVGFLLFALADVAYLILATQNLYVMNTPLDAVWLLGQFTIAFAAGPALLARESARGADGLRAVAVPLTFALGALSALLVSSDGSDSQLGATLAAATLALAMIRLMLGHAEVRRSPEHRAAAGIDDLTGLPSRRTFAGILDRALRSAMHADDDARRHALLLIDLDERFKEVNDSLGHATGDQLLHQVAQRMATQLRRTDVLARWSGDEFALLIPGADAEEAAGVAARLSATLREPFAIGGLTLHLGASVGIALYPDHAADGAELLREADVAMVDAKGDRQGWRIYRAEEDGHNRERLQFLDDLRWAATSGEGLVLHYQPKAHLFDGSITGVEALVRWQHPTRGMLFPDKFLPQVEEAGLMGDLTLTVLEQGIGQCAAWRAQGLELAVAINLSASSVVDDELPDLLAGFLDRHDLPANLLEVEITEDFLLGDRQRALDVLTRVRALGVTVSVDDYGTGYSSLAYLRDLPVDQLKLDRSFIQPMSADAGAAAIVRSTVALAHSLGLRMVAEGVEDEAAWAELVAYGCDQAQGYYLSRPVPPEQLVGWLTERRSAGDPVDAELAALMPRQADESALPLGTESAQG